MNYVEVELRTGLQFKQYTDFKIDISLSTILVAHHQPKSKRKGSSPLYTLHHIGQGRPCRHWSALTKTLPPDRISRFLWHPCNIHESWECYGFVDKNSANIHEPRLSSFRHNLSTLLPQWHEHPPKWVRPWCKLHTRTIPNPTNNNHQKTGKRDGKYVLLYSQTNAIIVWFTYVWHTVLAARLTLRLARLRHGKESGTNNWKDSKSFTNSQSPLLQSSPSSFSRYPDHASSAMARASSKVGQANCTRGLKAMFRL